MSVTDTLTDQPSTSNPVHLIREVIYTWNNLKYSLYYNPEHHTLREVVEAWSDNEPDRKTFLLNVIVPIVAQVDEQCQRLNLLPAGRRSCLDLRAFRGPS